MESVLIMSASKSPPRMPCARSRSATPAGSRTPSMRKSKLAFAATGRRARVPTLNRARAPSRARQLGAAMPAREGAEARDVMPSGDAGRRREWPCREF